MTLAVLLVSGLLRLATGFRAQLEDQNVQERVAAVSSGSSLRAKPQTHKLSALKSLMLASLAPVPMRPRMPSKFGRRAHRSVSMLFYDLPDVLACLNLGSPGEYQACLDLAQPWLKISPDGIVLTEAAKNGLTGGSIATLGAVATVLSGKNEVKERLACMYCDGTGQLTCGRCLSTGVLRFENSNGEIEEIQCPTCKGTRTVMCINCQGTGRTVPEDVFRKLGDEEQGFTEENYIGLIDETGRQPLQPGAGGQLFQPALAKEPSSSSVPSIAPADAKKVVFLGIDGVLQPSTTRAEPQIMLEPDKMKVLRDLVESEDLHIVLSSTWRSFDYYISFLFSQNHGIPVERLISLPGRGDLSQIGADDQDYEKRSGEIGDWLANNPGVSNFVILDDHAMAATGSLLPHLVHVKTTDGLTEADVEKCRRVLSISRPAVIDTVSA